MLYRYTFAKRFTSFNDATRNIYRVTRNTSFTKFYELYTCNSEEELRRRVRGIKHCSLIDLEDGWQVNYGTPSTKIQITVKKNVTEAEVRLKSYKWMHESSAVRDFESDGWKLKKTEELPGTDMRHYGALFTSVNGPVAEVTRHCAETIVPSGWLRSLLGASFK